MTSLLIIEASPRGESSVSHNLTSVFQQQWNEMMPDSKITYRNLNEETLPYVTASWLAAYFTPPDAQTALMKQELLQSDQYTQELIAADHLVISTPVYNYNIPAVLKSWIDKIVRKGITLGFDGKGLIKNKKATVLLASGGDYSEGSPIRDRDLAHQYLIMILKILGFDDVTLIAAGNAKSVDMGEISMKDFVGQFSFQLRQRIIDIADKN